MCGSGFYQPVGKPERRENCMTRHELLEALKRDRTEIVAGTLTGGALADRLELRIQQIVEVMGRNQKP